MAATSLITINSTATAITTTIPTVSVTIGEDAATPTTDIQIRAPLSTSPAIRRIKGTAATPSMTFTFQCPGLYWPAGTIVGYVQTVTGTGVSFGQYEQGF